jgi:predicted deacetylase
MSGGRKFVVSVHDVAPAASDGIARILRELHPRVGTTISAAVIPAPFDRNRGASFAALVRSQCREIALHGFSHCCPKTFHPLGLLTDHCSEFIGLSPVEARARLQRGQDILRAVFGDPASVFVPPAWCSGPVTPTLAGGSGLSALVTWTHLLTRATTIPLAVYSWDCGRFAWLAYAGEFCGFIRRHLGAGIPCVTLHPRDVSRSLLPRGLRVVDQLLRRGFSPATFADIAGLTPRDSLRETISAP